MTLRSVSVGHVALDLMFQIDAFPDHPTKKHADGFFQGVGGMAANSAVALSRLGAKAAFYGPVGDDTATPTFLQHFRRQGVDTRHVTPIQGQTNSISAIVTDASGERMIYSHKGSALQHPGPSITRTCCWPTRVVSSGPSRSCGSPDKGACPVCWTARSRHRKICIAWSRSRSGWRFQIRACRPITPARTPMAWPVPWPAILASNSLS